MKPILQIRLFGGLQISIGDDAPLRFSARRAEVLLAYLALNSRAHNRESLATLLWDDREQKQALANLRSLLAQLPKPIKPYLTTTRQTVHLPPGRVWVDALAFEHALTEAPAPDQLQAALTLYRGDFLEGVYVRESRGLDEWAALTRERFWQQAIDTHFQLAAHFLYQRDYKTGLGHARALLRLDPLREDAHRLTMRLLARAGQHNAALAHYQTCRQILENELGVPPAPETIRLYERVRAAKDAPAASIPAQFTPFVGREDEIAALTRQLDDPACRVLTLTGPGGTGKTRLALEVARTVQPDYLNGVHIVPLAATDDPASIPAAIAAALGLEFQGKAAPQDQLFQHLQNRETLLLLDNLEHLLPHAARFVQTLVEHALHLQILTTSRERLLIPSEKTFPVRGLPFEDKGAPAGQLFVAGARKVQPDFSLSDNETAVTRICTLLEGLPLGLELAAAWVHVLPVTDIAAEMEASLDLLAAREVGRPARHQSLHAAFEYSWRRLTPGGQVALKKLSVFRGGFTREAARRVAGARIHVLGSLVDKSLVYRLPAAGRFSILEVLRQFVLEKWENAEAHATAQEAHRKYFGAWLAQRELNLKGPTRDETLAAIGAELDNLRRAWQTVFSHDPPQPGDAAPFVEGLFALYHARGWYRDGFILFGRAADRLSATPSTSDKAHPPLRATRPGSGPASREWSRITSRQGNFAAYLGQADVSRRLLEESLSVGRELLSEADLSAALISLSQTAFLLGDYEASETAALEARAIFARQADQVGITIALRRLAYVASVRGNYGEAKGLLEEGLKISQELGDEVTLARIANSLANVAADVGEYETAAGYYQQALEVYRRRNALYSLAIVLNNLGTIDLALGNYMEAKDVLQESYALCEALDDEAGMGIVLANEGLVALFEGEFEKGQALFSRSVSVLRRINMPYMLALGLYGLGRVAVETGDGEAARAHLREAIAIGQETGGVVRTLQGVLGFASLYQKEGRLEEALSLAVFLQEHPAIIRELVEEAEELIAEISGLLSEEQVLAAREKGEGLRLEGEVERLLESEGRS